MVRIRAEILNTMKSWMSARIHSPARLSQEAPLVPTQDYRSQLQNVPKIIKY